jgi:predicted nucleic acid-binding protein
VIVVDASVIIKLLIDEPYSDLARACYLASIAQRQQILGPGILAAEVANGIYQRLRRGDIAPDEADDAVAQFQELGITLTGPLDHYEAAYAFTRTHRLPAVYDSHYVVLAQHLGVDLWTDDRRLLKNLNQLAPWVRWIGDYPADARTVP